MVRLSPPVVSGRSYFGGLESEVETDSATESSDAEDAVSEADCRVSSGTGVAEGASADSLATAADVVLSCSVVELQAENRQNTSPKISSIDVNFFMVFPPFMVCIWMHHIRRIPQRCRNFL